MRSGLVWAIVTFVLGIAVGALLIQQLPQLQTWFGQSAMPTRVEAPPSAPAGGGVWALGRLEPAHGVVDLYGIPGDRLKRLDVHLGSTVDEGTLLGQWESETLRAQELQIAEAQLAEARRTWQEELAAAAERVALAQLAEEHARRKNAAELFVEQRKLDALRLAAKYAEHRFQQLTVVISQAPHLVAQAELEEAQLQWERAEAELTAAATALDMLRKAHELTLERLARERQVAEHAQQRLQHEDRFQVLARQVELARQRCLESRFVAPCKGQVIRIYVQPGERVGQHPVLQIADVSQMVCIAEVPFDQVNRIHPGQVARVFSRAFGDQAAAGYLEGRVEQIGVVTAMPGLRPLDPFAPADRHSLEVRIGLDSQASRVAAQYLYLQTEVQFLLDPAAGPP